LNLNIFIEQAEYIASEEFQKWAVEHPEEETIVRKLSQGGAKLLIGPRGSGKTTLMLKTFYKLCSPQNISNTKSSLPIYVNFKSSLKIEPIYKSNANAVYWFNQWILFKIYQGLFGTLEELAVETPDLMKFTRKSIDKIINNIEFRHVELLKSEDLITLEDLEEEIQKVLTHLNKSHCVLLLDDAAHAFSADQQRDFFEFFRQIKSKLISPKAAVYPGVTIYSSTFHVGHDAEEIDVWIKPDSTGYTDFMLGLLERRLPEQVYKEFLKKKDLIELVAYASFGMPRAFLNMMRDFYKEENDEEKSRSSLSRKGVSSALSESFKQTMGIYSSLKVQLPTYEKFIVTGESLFSKMVDLIKNYNKGKETNAQSVSLAISRPIPVELSKVLGFFQYAGLIMPKGEVSKGGEGVYELYMVHYASLIDRNAFVGKKSIGTQELIESLRIRNSHLFKKVTPQILLGTDDISSLFPLSLPPCHKCRTPRNNEHAKFCPNCGALLKSVSVFESLISNDIDKLPLTVRRVQSIKQHSKIKTVKDILMDLDNSELRKVPQIGPHWAKQIYSYAEEFIV
jgi:hypothetical protein